MRTCSYHDDHKKDSQNRAKKLLLRSLQAMQMCYYALFKRWLLPSQLLCSLRPRSVQLPEQASLRKHFTHPDSLLLHCKPANSHSTTVKTRIASPATREPASSSKQKSVDFYSVAIVSAQPADQSHNGFSRFSAANLLRRSFPVLNKITKTNYSKN